jgi:hypothetical protein
LAALNLRDDVTKLEFRYIFVIFRAPSDNIGSISIVTVQAICPLCGVRKAKRNCPALGKRICAVCCATKRLSEIACPESCAYLASARIHPAAAIQRRQERDLRFLLPLVSDLTEPQSRLMLFFQAVILRHAAEAIPAVLDIDVAEAAAAVAATLETARKGVIYQHEPVSIPAQRLASALREGLVALKPESAAVARLEADGATALRQIERAARTAQDVLSGDEAPIFLGVIKRVLADRSAHRDEVEKPATPDGGPLIVPG